MDEADTRERPAVLLGAGVLSVAGAGVLQARGSAAFQPYFGAVNPILATTSVVVLGAAALAFLHRQWSFRLYVPGVARKGLAITVTAAIALAAPVVLVDLFGGFPRGINVEAPESLLFYPVIALVAVSVFHAVPLAILLWSTGPLQSRLGRERTLWFCMILAACIEPTFQVVRAPPESPVWATAYVSAHVLIFNVLALYIFKRYDFLATYFFRALYYLFWHVLWGFIRLGG